MSEIGRSPCKFLSTELTFENFPFILEIMHVTRRGKSFFTLDSNRKSGSLADAKLQTEEIHIHLKIQSQLSNIFIQ